MYKYYIKFLMAEQIAKVGHGQTDSNVHFKKLKDRINSD